MVTDQGQLNAQISPGVDFILALFFWLLSRIGSSFASRIQNDSKVTHTPKSIKDALLQIWQWKSTWANMLLLPFENTRSDWSRAASAAGLPRMLCKTDYKVVLSYKMCVKCLCKCIRTQNSLIVKLRILLIIDMDWPI